MNINKLTSITNTVNTHTSKIKQEKSLANNTDNKEYEQVSSDVLKAYNGISFKGKAYDGTNFRNDLEKRADISTTKINLFSNIKYSDKKYSFDRNTPEQELTLYKTNHHEYVKSVDGSKIYKIKYVDNEQRIMQQIIASKLYQSIGVRTPEYIAFEKDGKTGWLVEVFEEKLSPASTNKDALYESFIADVWLGNRNGLSKNNTMIDEKGNPVKMSVSGSLGYRASGKPKESGLDDKDIPEIYTMRDSSINFEAAQALSDMSNEDLYKAVAKFLEKYNYEKQKKIVSEYKDDIFTLGLSHILSNRYSKLREFTYKDKIDKKIEERGLLDKNNPNLTNLYHCDLKNDDSNRKYLTEITDEQWKKLQDRGLLVAKPGLKKFSLLDYTYLGKMTDEEHSNALKRGLYAPRNSDNKLTCHSIGGHEILHLSKISDTKWNKVVERNLLNAKDEHHIKEFWLADFINQVVDINDNDWFHVEYSKILDTNCKAEHIFKFLEILKSDDIKNLSPSFIARVRMLSLMEKDKYYFDKKYEADSVLYLASQPNKNWDRFVEITKNLTDTKMSAGSWNTIFEYDDETYEKIKERGLFNKAEHSYGLQEMSMLTDEEWKNIKKRKIDELPDQSFVDIAQLAALSDEKWELAKEKGLFENRSKSSTNYYKGEDIALLVDSLDEKDWENFKERGLFDRYKIFNGWCYDVPHAIHAVKLAKLTDNEFTKFNKIASQERLYPETIYELINLSEEELHRVFKRNLFQYVNTYEAWDNWTEDAPVMKALAELNDTEYKMFLSMHDGKGSIATKVLTVKLKGLGLDKKQEINELTINEKRKYLQLLLNKNDSFIYAGETLRNSFNNNKLIPTNITEFTELMNKLIKAVGIDTNPITENQKSIFFNTLQALAEPNSEFRKLDIKNPEFKLTVQYPRDSFKKDILKLVSCLNENEKSKVWDYFGFELKENSSGKFVLTGYPTLLNNGEKLAEITNPQTKAVISQIKPYVKNFTQENKILPDGKFISPQMAEELNNIFSVLPELFTIVGKKQHTTHDYTVDVHTLAVLKECIQNPYFNQLSPKDKRILILTSLMHDITKEEYEIDKNHPQESAFDSYYILEKLGLSNEEHMQIYQMIKNHNMLEMCNKKIYDYDLETKRPMTEDEQNKKIRKYAYELRSENLANLMTIFTKADLLSVQRNSSFYNKYCDALNKISKKLSKEITTVKSTSICLPQTKIPKASSLRPDGKNLVETTTIDKDGNEIKNKVLYLEKGLDLSQYGFANGVNADNFNVIIHGFDTEKDRVVLDALELANQNALLSASYVVYSKGNYHAFRQQGFIKEVDDDNIGAAYFRDFGSGCKKTVENLVNNYINGGDIYYRKYLPNLIKETLNLSDREYIALYEEIKNKPMDVLEQERPYVAHAMKDIFAKMEIHKRKFQRDYNEVLITKGKNKAIYFVGKKEDGSRYQVEDIPEFLRKYAQDNDLPIIYFGE